MKEEAETCSKLPPKIMGGSVGGGLAMTMAPATNHSTSAISTSATGAHSSCVLVNSLAASKLHNDEILTSLLRMNNFDSISSIKDESLDIDLSACVTITADTSGMIGGNSLSSSDFWRVLDESAQTSQLDGSGGSTSASVGQCPAGHNTSKELLHTSSSPSSNNNTLISNDKNSMTGIVVKKEQMDFSGTFLKPSVGITFSPLKRCSKPMPVEQTSHNDKSLPMQIKGDGGGGGMNTAAGPPSLAPLVRIHQFPKPSIEVQKFNGSNATPNEIVIKKELICVSQLPPLTALDATANTTAGNNNKNETITKVTAEPQYKCMDCNIAFQGSQELANHTNHHIIYKCMECNNEFDTEPLLKKHLKTHRPVDARKDAWKKCPDCGKCLKLGSMWMHRKIHTENKKYGCEICGQKFVQKINLTHHQRIHTSEKPYECSECQKRFQERSHLQRHQKYHAQTRSYRCEKCGKMYKTERCLKVHNLVHLEQRPFACTVCDKSFISNSKLKQHSNIHTGERPFKCNYCPRDFTNFPNWLKHTRRRHKVDHKTGEMLENIPSYCSKKSTRTPKEKKPTAAEVKAQASAKIVNNSQSQNPASMNTNSVRDLNKMDTSASTLSTKVTTASIVASMVPASVVTVAPKSNVAINGPPPLAKVPAKRKKKVQPSTATVVIKNESDGIPKSYIITAVSTKAQTNPIFSTSNGGVGPPPLALVFNTKPINVATNVTTTSITSPLSSTIQITQTQSLKPPTKSEKSKRERKQPMPKQVQQVPPPLIIKKEFIEPKSEINVQHQAQESHHQQSHHHRQHPSQSQSPQTKGQFPDLHCLSITSAEELIMEQALEMEECGLYKSPSTTSRRVDVIPNFGDTDNAISSETMADLHFKIKEEQHDMELKLKTEELDSIKKNMCSSLESSPFSSPASMEFASTSALTSDFSTNNFYLPPFTLTSNQIFTTNTSIATTAMKFENSHVMSGGATIHRVQVPQLVAANLSVPELIQITQSNQRQIRANLTAASNNNISSTNGDNASSFINQLYLPLTVNAGPVLMKSHQALPSVDTLLFSHSKLGLFNNRNLPKQATTAQPNLS